MILTQEMKTALRKRKAELMLNQQQTANELGLHPKTVEKYLRNPNAEEVRTTTFQKISNWLAKGI
jgi:predicted transcriptional regulator